MASVPLSARRQALIVLQVLTRVVETTLPGAGRFGCCSVLMPFTVISVMV